MGNKPKYNPQIHHRRSIRLKGYDYSQEGLYFITIVVKNKEHLFGEITDGKMTLNEYGRVASDMWLNIPMHFPDCKLHEHVVMPNHVHGIIEITQNVGVQNFEPLQHEPNQNKFQKIIPRSIGSIVRGYKTGVTKWFREHTDLFTIWQRNYYEETIRDENAYYAITNYIINNPLNWEQDSDKP